MKTLERIEANAKQLMQQYSTSEQLLSDAMKESMGWAMGLVTRKALPSVPQLERLATQLVAIVMASEQQDE